MQWIDRSAWPQPTARSAASRASRSSWRLAPRAALLALDEAARAHITTAALSAFYSIVLSLACSLFAECARCSGLEVRARFGYDNSRGTDPILEVDDC